MTVLEVSMQVFLHTHRGKLNEEFLLVHVLSVASYPEIWCY